MMWWSSKCQRYRSWSKDFICDKCFHRQKSSSIVFYQTGLPHCLTRAVSKCVNVLYTPKPPIFNVFTYLATVVTGTPGIEKSTARAYRCWLFTAGDSLVARPFREIERLLSMLFVFELLKPELMDIGAETLNFLWITYKAA